MSVCLCRPFVQHPECATHPASLRVEVDDGVPVRFRASMLPAIVDRDPGDETDAE